MIIKIKISAISDIIIFLFFCNILGDALNLTILNIIVALSVGCTLLRGVSNFIKGIASSLGIWLISFTICIFCSCLWALSYDSAMNMAKTFIKVAFMSIFIYLETDTFDKLIIRIKQFLVATVFMMAKVMLAYFSGHDRLNAFSYGTGNYFNTVAQILALSVVLAFWFIINQNKGDKKTKAIIYYIYIIMAFAMIIWSGSRKSILIPVVGIVSIVLIGKFDFKARFRYIALGVLVAMVVLYIVQSNDMLSGRFKDFYNALFLGSDDDASALERQFYRNTAWNLFTQKPILGWGANGFMVYLERINYWHVAYCHNNWLEILCSYGIIGGILYYWFYFYLLVKLYSVRQNHLNLGTVLFSIVFIILIFEYGIVTYYFSIYNILFCFAAILLKCNNKIVKREN